MLTVVHTKTYALLGAWAQSLPWNCDRPGHQHTPMVGDPCAVEDCREPLRARQACYRVTEQDGYVCWRHVRPDDGPLVVPA